MRGVGERKVAGPVSKQKKNHRLVAKLGVIAGAAVVGTDRADAEIVRANPFATAPSSVLRPPGGNAIPSGNEAATSALVTGWDVDGDSTVDFNLVNLMVAPLEAGSQLLGAQIMALFQAPNAGSGNGWIKNASNDKLQRLDAGATVGALQVFGGAAADGTLNLQTGYIGVGSSEGTPVPSETLFNPNWTLGEPGNFGFKFTKGGNLHYGWGVMEIDQLKTTGLPASGQGFVITNAYYETAPGVPVTVGAVPEPSSIALLSMGAAGVAAWKVHRKRRQAASQRSATVG
jgi:hypothetical protein